ncbi:T9SS type A sorting domain-containing protein [uncultured Parabacteroides sp.]|uniref:T9SS type A sorting domain-containing protein n=1 Tax=uncultured Parabacteroides sp. TaxID=512312 RepID=UPI0026081F0D|nr:T9SS type A sorting domain-containing protein [uncultured Parabacteroides sp.]
MKKKVIHFVHRALVKILFFGASYQLHAQVSNPSSWESFVNSDDNILVSDTFRLQTFGKSIWDNWIFSLNGNSSVVQDKFTMKIPVGSGTTFQPISSSIYDEVKIAIHVAGLNLAPKENLLFDTYRNEQNETVIGHTSTSDKDFFKYNTLIIGKAPSSISLRTLQASSSKGGYYMTDSVYTYGDIPSYSLFSGIGNWNDTTLWSHLPPLRHRNALIKGDVNITTDTYCKDIAICSGSLQINPGNRFILQNLDVYENEAFLYSEGTILLSDRITLHKTFEEAGKWYFISFPFDVYPSGIDPRFEQKDATPNDGGNYFYVQSYNGDKRSSTNQSAGNWEVVPIRPENVPLFEKNKGYLIALDEKATDRTLSFSSHLGDIPEDFAHTGVSAIPLGSDITSDNQENYGWYLCGNPFPAPLVLSQIEKNSALDGNIYIYDGSGYKTYSLNSNYALPPFAAFFIKASSPTELKVSSNNTSTKAMEIIQTNFPLNESIAEPHPAKQNTAIGNPYAKDFHFFIKDKQLYLRNIPETGYIRLLNMMGQCLLQKEIRQGSQVIRITDRPGMYILQIHSAKYQKHQKVILL